MSEFQLEMLAMDSMDGSGDVAYRMFPSLVAHRHLTAFLTSFSRFLFFLLFFLTWSHHVVLVSAAPLTDQVGSLTRAIRYHTLYSVPCNMAWIFPPVQSSTARNGTPKS